MSSPRELIPSHAESPDGFLIKQPNLKDRRALRFLRHRTSASHNRMRQQYVV